MTTGPMEPEHGPDQPHGHTEHGRDTVAPPTIATGRWHPGLSAGRVASLGPDGRRAVALCRPDASTPIEEAPVPVRLSPGIPLPASPLAPSQWSVPPRPTVGMLSAFPPRLCGLATFAAALSDAFDDRQLAHGLEALADDAATRRRVSTTAAHLRHIALGSYRVDFPDEVALADRVLWPHAPDERNGMEDARFVEITDGSGPRYCATYTAFDGVDIHQYLLTTEDFRSFEAGPMAGPAARGKGLALFPRRVGGRHLALSRADRETNALAISDDLRCWDLASPLQHPTRTWEVLQLGNCGSPIETDRGWLVLTHGVGPMRTYSIGAILLDVDEPQRVIGATVEPLLEPHGDRQDGYVPNVVYTCGALVHGGRLVVPYAIGDQRIALASASIDDVLDAMERP